MTQPMHVTAADHLLHIADELMDLPDRLLFCADMVKDHARAIRLGGQRAIRGAVASLSAEAVIAGRSPRHRPVAVLLRRAVGVVEALVTGEVVVPIGKPSARAARFTHDDGGLQGQRWSRRDGAWI